MAASGARHPVRDVLISAASLVLLVFALASLHGGLRSEIVRTVREAPASSVAVAVSRARDAATVMLRSAWEQATEYQMFTVFIVTALVVFLCMVNLKPDR